MVPVNLTRAGTGGVLIREGSPDLSVIIPVFNERENLAPLLDELEGVLEATRRSYEVIAVDDGSTDGSRERLRELAKTREFLKLIFFRRNSGQTPAFDAGFRYASGKIVVTMDSDLQNDPGDIPAMLRLLEAGYDVVAGWRRKRADGYVGRTIPSRVANRIIRTVTGTKIHDLGCSLKVFRREIVLELKLYGEMHRFIGALAEGMGARVTEVEVNHRPRTSGKSKYGILRTFKVLLDLMTVWFLQGYRTKPIYVFGGVSLALMVTATLTTAFVAWQKLVLALWVHKNPLFVLAITLYVIAFQFLGLGLLAELIIRTYFESQDKTSYSIGETKGLPFPGPSSGSS